MDMTPLEPQDGREDYAKLAKEFGCQLRFGKYGVKFINRDPLGNIYKLVQIIPLWGWITDPNEIINAIRLDDELGIVYNPDQREDGDANNN